MPDPIVHTSEPVTLVGGAEFAAIDLNISLSVAPVLVAADGGANAILAAAREPHAVIGDFDSISPAARAAFDAVMHHDPDQDTTDFEKAITRIAAPFIVALGFTGARMDHTLAVLGMMAQHSDRGVILLAADDVAFMAPATMTLTLPPDTRLSLMPLGDVTATTDGLRWDLLDAPLHPTGAGSPSNAVKDDVVTVRSKGPLLTVLPRAHLDAAIAAVRGRSHKAPPPS